MDELSDFMGAPASENVGIEIGELEVVDSYADADQTAKSAWESGDAFRYIYKSCESYHIGDKWSIKIMILTYAGTQVLNSKGMHVGLNGKAGTGKSHLTGIVGDHLPEGVVISGRFSDKSLFHKEGMKPGHVVIIDDQALTESFEEMFKQVSSKFHAPYLYHSVGRDLKEVVHTIPPETVFWMCKAEMVGDEQTQDRQFILNTDDSPEQLESIKDSIIADALDPSREADDFTQVVSRKIWKYVPKAYVSIPYAKEITTDGDIPDARNLNLLLDLVRTCALMHASVRAKGEPINGNLNIIADYADFMIASRLMNRLLSGKGGSQKHKAGQNGERVLKLLAEEYSKQPTDVPIPRKELCAKLHMSTSVMTYTIHGRNNRGTDGLESICPAIEEVNMNTPNHSGSGGTYTGKGILWNYREYLKWGGRAESYILKDEDGNIVKPEFYSDVFDDLVADENEEEMKKMQTEEQAKPDTQGDAK